MYYEPADAAIPTEKRLVDGEVPRFVPRLLRRVRERFGFDIHLLHDVHHRLTPIEAARLGKEVEPSRLYWLEDPTPAEHQDGLRLIREHTTTPIAVGEVFNSLWDCERLIGEQLIDFLRCAVTHAGGITHMRKIAALAELHQVRTGCHGPPTSRPSPGARPTSTSPSTTSACTNTSPTPGDRRGLPARLHARGRLLHPGEEPGHGVDIDETVAEYPYDARRPARRPPRGRDPAQLVIAAQRSSLATASPRPGSPRSRAGRTGCAASRGRRLSSTAARCSSARCRRGTPRRCARASSGCARGRSARRPPPASATGSAWRRRATCAPCDEWAAASRRSSRSSRSARWLAPTARRSR